MKKSLLALVVLGSFAGVASAANSVTLYGTAEIAYQKDKGSSLKQAAPGESRIGFKGTEDLGNGMAAFFQMEARFNLDTGANTGTVDGTGFFDEKSVVGLSFANGVHKVYFGKSASPLDRLGNNVGHLHSDMGTMASEGGWRNGMFYDYEANGLLVAAAATTKGGMPSNATNEGVAGTKSSYGIAAKYSASNWHVGAGWQADNDADIKNEWKVVGAYTFSPVTIGGSYARAKAQSNAKVRTIQAHVKANLTSNDVLMLTAYDQKWGDSTKTRRYALGYSHSLSKRTSVFANVGRKRVKTYAGAAWTSSSGTGYDVGVKHTF